MGETIKVHTTMEDFYIFLFNSKLTPGGGYLILDAKLVDRGTVTSGTGLSSIKGT